MHKYSEYVLCLYGNGRKHGNKELNVLITNKWNKK